MEYLVKCLRLDHFGRGICFVNGKIVFVKNLLSEEEAYIKLILDKKKFSVGEIVYLEKKSNFRIKPLCPYLNCGCHIKHLVYEKQLEFKEKKVLDILQRYGHITPKISKVVKCDNIFHYRNKITLKVRNGVGYYSNGTNDIILIQKCELAGDKTNQIIKILNNLDLSLVKEIVIKEFDQVMLIIDGYLDIKSLIPIVDSIYMDNKLVYGLELIQTKIDDFIFHISKEAFFQVNTNMIKKLYNIAINYLGNDYDKTVLDLYCGTGTISLFLSKVFKEVIGVDINKEAIKCANINKNVNNISNVTFICKDASKDMIETDYVVVDPPRSGLDLKGINYLLKFSPEKIVYISCDPMTLARDLNLLREKYDVSDITIVDMFPHTYHVETVTLLEKK